MKDNINSDIKNITVELKDLLKLIDNLEVEIIDTNKTNEHKIIMYKMMMENIILEYHETCKKLFIK